MKADVMLLFNKFELTPNIDVKLLVEMLAFVKLPCVPANVPPLNVPPVNEGEVMVEPQNVPPVKAIPDTFVAKIDVMFAV